MQPDEQTRAFTEQDWAHFDFTRFNLDGLNLGGSASTFASLAQRLFQSSEWRQHFQAGIFALKSGVLQYFEQRAKTLQERRAAREQEFKGRSANVAAQTASLQKTLRTSVAPATLAAVPGTYRLGARVVSDDSNLGLPGIRIRLVHPQQREQILTEAFTDMDGNAVLELSGDNAKPLPNEMEAIVEVITPAGKVVKGTERAVCPRRDKTETTVITLPAAADLEPNVALAKQINDERTLRFQNLLEKPERLRSLYAQLNKGLEAELEETARMIEAIRNDLSADKDRGKPAASRKFDTPSIFPSAADAATPKPHTAATTPASPPGATLDKATTTAAAPAAGKDHKKAPRGKKPARKLPGRHQKPSKPS